MRSWTGVKFDDMTVGLHQVLYIWSLPELFSTDAGCVAVLIFFLGGGGEEGSPSEYNHSLDIVSEVSFPNRLLLLVPDDMIKNKYVKIK